MARLAIFVDGGYVDALAQDEFGVWVDFQKFPEEIRQTVASKTPEALDLLRTFYYHCLPYQSNPPTLEQAKRFGAKRRFFDFLRRLSRFTVREGRLVYEGAGPDVRLIFHQKRTDLLLGLDFALLSGKHQITHAAVVAGDSDLLPAFEVASRKAFQYGCSMGPGPLR